MTFQTSILCQRIGIAKDGFYSSMREGHKYDANDNAYLDTLGYDFDPRTLDSRADKDLNPMAHEEKYLLINQAFAGKQRLMPFFNRTNNEDLILAIQAAGVTRGRNGFHQNKAGEKLAESEEDLLQHRTDAFDTLYIGAEKFPFHDTFSVPMSGVM